jgi:hypothetical protein
MKKKLAWVWFFLFGITGCAGSFEETRGRLAVGATPPSQRCIDLDAAHRHWASSAQASGLLAGAAGISSLPLRKESEAAQIGVAAGSLAAAAWSVFSVTESSGAAESWARECRSP